LIEAPSSLDLLGLCSHHWLFDCLFSCWSTGQISFRLQNHSCSVRVTRPSGSWGHKMLFFCYWQTC